MTKYKHIIIAILISVFCSSVLAFDSAEVFCGLKFELNTTLTIFNTLSFCCMSNFLKTTTSSPFKKNLISIIKYRSRKNALKFELLKKAKKTFFYSLCNIGSIFIFESINNVLILRDCVVFSYFNITIMLFLMFFQYYLELFVSIDYGFYFINFFYIIGVLSGHALHQYYMSHDNLLSVVALYFNRLNILNYLSVDRIEDMNASLPMAATIILVLIILSLVLLSSGIKKIDILCEERI